MSRISQILEGKILHNIREIRDIRVFKITS